jgi:hypothetical protein
MMDIVKCTRWPIALMGDHIGVFCVAAVTKTIRDALWQRFP